LSPERRKKVEIERCLKDKTGKRPIKKQSPSSDPAVGISGFKQQTFVGKWRNS